MPELSRSFSLVCLILILSALPISAQTAQIQNGVPWQDASVQGASAPAGAHVSYFGGPVVSNAVVIQVLYGAGSYNPQVAGTSSPTIGNFFGDFLGTNSGYVNLLSQYSPDFSGSGNQIIGYGAFGGIFRITPSTTNNGSTINDSNIQAELLAQINAGHLPAPLLDLAGNVNTTYMIYFPLGKTIISSQGLTSCVNGGFCAYHGTTSNTLNTKHLLYGVMPDMQAGSGCSTGCGTSSVFGNYTTVTSHELSETITDADVGIATGIAKPLAWYDPNNGEIGDICNHQQGSYTANGTVYTIQFEFSNAANNCVLPPPAPSTHRTASGTLAQMAFLDSIGSATGFIGGQDVFYAGTDLHVHRIFSNTAWHTNDVTTASGAPNVASGNAVAGLLDTIGAATMFVGGQDLFYVAADLHIHHIFSNTVSNTAWHTDDITAASGAAPAVSGESVAGFLDIIGTATGLLGGQDVFYVGADQHIHNIFSNSAWHTNDITVASGAPLAASGSSVAAFLDTVGAATGLVGGPDVFYVSTDQHIHNIFSNSAWHTNDITAASDAPLAAPGSSVAAFLDTVGADKAFVGGQNVFYVGTDQHIHHIYSDTAWHTDDITVKSGAALAASGSSIAAFLDTVGVATGLVGGLDVFYVGTDQHVHHIYSNSVWQTEDITAKSSAALAVSSGSLAGFLDTIGFATELVGGQDIFYVGTDQHIHHIYSNSVWQTDDITAKSSAPLAN
ncbi:MAG TPA: hypothetical protein VFR24_17435 [Candidatus Angelobacter sp.]|nr:hypothetical protein [Candidatus Angelobacter sp.]